MAEPITDATYVDVGTNGASRCALRTSGVVACWGTNTSGQTGTGSTGTVDAPTSVSGLSDAIQLSVGGLHACALREGGIPTCWGSNSQGRLGDGTIGGASAPRPVVIVEDSSEAYEDFVQIEASYAHTCGIRATGAVLCWGVNSYRRLGIDAATTQSLVPVEVPGLTDVVSIHSHADADHTCALHGDGTVSCWGSNTNGQLGTDSANTTGDLASKVPGLSDIVAVSVGADHSCALPEEGAPWCWGYNGFGQLGDGSTTQRDAPVRVANLP
jgi:alpha-tubulin suppressor-like RCC1 family protein